MNFIKVFFKILVFFSTGLVSLKASPVAEINPIVPEKEIVSYNFSVPASLFQERIKDYFFEDKGSLIFSSGQKLGFYNGINWAYLNLEKAPIISISPSGSIFIVQGNTIFTLQIDIEQNYYLAEYESILLENNEIIEQIKWINEGILINTGRKLYFLFDSELTTLIGDGENIRVFSTETRLIIRNKERYAGFSGNSGLGSWSENKEELCFFKDHDQGYIAYSKYENSLHILSPSFAKKMSFGLNYIGVIRDIIPLSNNNYGIISDEEIFFMMNSKGKIFRKTNLFGINENSLIKKSPFNRLWISTNQGFTILDLSSPFQKLTLPELQSDVISLCDNLEKLYFSDSHSLQQISGTKILKREKIKDLKKYKKGILYLENNQLNFIDGEKSSSIFKGEIVGYKIDPVTDNILIEKDSKYLLLKENSSGTFERIQEYETKLNSDPNFYNNTLIYNKENTIFFENLLSQSRDSLLFVPEKKNEKIMQLVSGLNGTLVGTHENAYLLGKESIQKLNLAENNAIISYQNLILSSNKSVLLYLVGSNESPGFLRIILSDGKQETIPFLSDNFLNHQDFEILRTESGKYYFSSSNEIYSFSLKDSDNEKQLSLLPERIIINKEEVFSGQNFELTKAHLQNNFNQISYSDNSIRIDFRSSDFFSHSNSFQYILIGRDTKWVDWQKGNSLSFEKLSPGDYQLKIRVANANSYVSEKFQINFTILHPFYLTSLAKAFYVLLFFGGLFVFYRQYKLVSHKLPVIEEDKLKVESFHKAEPVTDIANAEGNEAVYVGQDQKKSKWDKYEMVTVLFSDIQGFTKIAEQMNPERLIDELDQFFYHFDSVVDKYKIEKIKTIGDAYMAAGGIPKKNHTNPVEVVLAALEVQQYMKEVKKTKVDIWDLRIGIHTGPVIAGIAGYKKKTNDIWGDSVNIASRMESSGEGGKVNISGVTYNLIKDFFLCEYRGKIPVKYKGNLDMYFVKGLRPELSINLVGLPNKKFFLKLQLLRLIDIENYVFNKLQEELPEQMCFHDSEYAKQVYKHSLLLCKAESLDVEETLEIRTANLIIPLGYISNYENPETEAGNITHEILNEFQYSERQINVISNLILSTKRPYEPQNILEKIMIDAKLEYHGRADYIQLYKKLFREEAELIEIKDSEKWKKEQVDFLVKFEYYTAGARRLREISFENQIKEIEKDIW